MGEIWRLERGGDGYPSCLEDLDAIAGEGAPAELYGRGDRALIAGLDPSRTVTIVGARQATAIGREAAAELAGSLTAAGVLVISGMAYGIDTAAHSGALAAGGPTVAVLACGPDRAYPPSARSLYRRILASGAVLSEAEPGYEPGRWDFPKRNRIMAALAAMTVVVEAKVRSGSLVTADHAGLLGRDVGAIPGPVSSPLAAGPHHLIREGAALVRGPQDVLDQVLGVGEASATRIGPALDDECQVALGAVRSGASSLGAVGAEARLDPSRTAVALARLELLGYVTVGAGRYSQTGLEPP